MSAFEDSAANEFEFAEAGATGAAGIKPAVASSSRNWNPDHALMALAEEATMRDVNIHDPSQLKDAVDRLFRESAQLSAMSILHLSLHEPNPRIRLDASKYVIERATALGEGDADPLMTLVSELYAHLGAVEAGE